MLDPFTSLVRSFACFVLFLFIFFDQKRASQLNCLFLQKSQWYKLYWIIEFFVKKCCSDGLSVSPFIIQNAQRLWGLTFPANPFKTLYVKWKAFFIPDLEVHIENRSVFWQLSTCGFLTVGVQSTRLRVVESSALIFRLESSFRFSTLVESNGLACARSLRSITVAFMVWKLLCSVCDPLGKIHYGSPLSLSERRFRLQQCYLLLQIDAWVNRFVEHVGITFIAWCASFIALVLF